MFNRNPVFVINVTRMNHGLANTWEFVPPRSGPGKVCTGFYVSCLIQHLTWYVASVFRIVCFWSIYVMARWFYEEQNFMFYDSIIHMILTQHYDHLIMILMISFNRNYEEYDNIPSDVVKSWTLNCIKLPK